MTTSLATKNESMTNAPIGFSEWLEFGRTLYDQKTALDWSCADWLADGQGRYPEQMSLVLPMLAPDVIEQKKIMKLARVAVSIPSSHRCVALSLDHHIHVANLPPEDRMDILSRALSENLSARATRIIALERKTELGVGGATLEEDDWEYRDLMAIIHRWNNACPDARQSFFDMAKDAGLGVIAA